MPSSYEEVVNKEVMIRDLLSSFPDASSLNKTCGELLEKLELLSTDWSTTGSTIHIDKLKNYVEELTTVASELASCIELLKSNSIETTGYEKVIESRISY